MILLDSDNESFTLQNKWWSIIPISFDRIFGEELRITVFPGAEDIAKEFEDKYGDGPMSDQALSFLENKISERYLPLGKAMDSFAAFMWQQRNTLPSGKRRLGCTSHGCSIIVTTIR